MLRQIYEGFTSFVHDIHHLLNPRVNIDFDVQEEWIDDEHVKFIITHKDGRTNEITARAFTSEQVAGIKERTRARIEGRLAH